ncbi:methyltransferase regulatory domain-containing protein [Chthonobacter albigriseus]|uniref:methyltransferase regulatory domain-containing protein n=1 Tax=Chthonobacter albigriseus TaxID=1683161 RepID=UPI0015EE592A|nr:methyltransferase regulatory domain-containing protein [Chthonobacter albigriseus]
MPGWTGGYVTDITYTESYHRDCAPTLLAFAALAAGFRAPDPAAPLRICDLGCGYGLTAAVLAAANPGWQVHGVDFNPAHIAAIRRLAEAGGLDNAHFHDESFAEFCARPDLPAFDIVTLQGVWTWVSPEDRDVITAFLRRHLKPGGLVFCAYNALPGWSAAAPLRALLKTTADAAAGSPAERLDAAFAFLDRLSAVDPAAFRNNPALAERLALNRGQDRRYLAHEYLNRHWQPFHVAEVAAALAEAKLDYLGPASLIDGVDAANLTADQRAFLDTLSDPILRETARDFILNRHFRADVYVKGRERLFSAEADAGWHAARFVLATPRAAVPATVVGHLGRIRLLPEIYDPILDALADGPLAVADLAGRPGLSAVNAASLRQALAVLVGAGIAEPCLPAEGLEARAAAARRFNRAVLERAAVATDIQWLASPVTGGGVQLDRLSQLFLLAETLGADPADTAWPVLARDNQRLLHDGRRLDTPEENRAELTRRHATFQSAHRPTLTRLGI